MKSSIYEVEHPRSCERGGSEPFEREKELSCGEAVRERAPTLACARKDRSLRRVKALGEGGRS